MNRHRVYRRRIIGVKRVTYYVDLMTGRIWTRERRLPSWRRRTLTAER